MADLFSKFKRDGAICPSRLKKIKRKLRSEERKMNITNTIIKEILKEVKDGEKNCN